MSGVEYPSVAAMPMQRWSWPHVNPTAEWACKGTGKIKIVPVFLDKFEMLRGACGFPLPINSGYRSPEHNKKVATTGDDGPHTTGQACDVIVTGPQAFVVIREAMRLGFGGIGVRKLGGGMVMVHLDCCDDAPERPRPCFWGY